MPSNKEALIEKVEVARISRESDSVMLKFLILRGTKAECNQISPSFYIFYNMPQAAELGGI